jgi:hypothetical protein
MGTDDTITASRFRPRRRHLAAGTVLSLLLFPSLITVRCPVCQACGYVSRPHMEEVTITGVKSAEPSLLPAVEGEASHTEQTYAYELVVSALNQSASRARGYIRFTLTDATDGTTLLEVYGRLEMEGNTAREIPYTLLRDSEGESFRPAVLKAEVALNDMPDIACQGSGRVSLMTWPLANWNKARLKLLSGVGARAAGMLPGR